MKITSSKNKLFLLSLVFVLGFGIQNTEAQRKKKKKSKKGETEQVDATKKNLLKTSLKKVRK